jgi:alpha-tubulin suppressor-like RCC1 family protein
VSASAPNSTVEAWGSNQYGQLGDGGTSNASQPVTVQGLNPASIKQLAVGGGFNLALLDDGTVMAWGANSAGELGNGTTSESLVPVTVPGLSDVSAIAAGNSDGYALLSNGKVMAWGWNRDGEVGLGFDSKPSICPCVTVPTLIPRLSGVQSIVAGEYHALVLLKSGRVKAWGNNTGGEVGIGRRVITVDHPTRVAVQGVADLAAGGGASYALLTNGSVMAWGSGAQLGNGQFYSSSQQNQYSPVLIQGLTGLGVSSIAAGSGETFALLSNGNVMAWGGNVSGQLGLRSTESQIDVPTVVPGLSDIVAVSGGSGFGLALNADGNVWAWGDNSDGQLGESTITKSNVPVQIPGLSGVARLGAGAEYGVAW